MKGVTGKDGDVKTGVGATRDEVKRRLLKKMRGKSGEARTGDAKLEGRTGLKEIGLVAVS